MKKILLDFVLLTLFLAAMGFQFLPKVLHEVLGVVFPVLVAVHLYLNRAWFRALSSGKQSALRAVSSLVNVALIILCLSVLLTGIFISNHLFADIIPQSLNRNTFVRRMHVSLPYYMLLFLGLHLGLHWRGVKERIGQKLPKIFDRRTNSALVTIFAAIMCAVGVYGSFLNQIGDRLSLNLVFGTAATATTPTIYFFLLLGIVVLYAAIGHNVGKFLSKLLTKKIKGA